MAFGEEERRRKLAWSGLLLLGVLVANWEQPPQFPCTLKTRLSPHPFKIRIFLIFKGQRWSSRRGSWSSAVRREEPALIVEERLLCSPLGEEGAPHLLPNQEHCMAHAGKGKRTMQRAKEETAHLAAPREEERHEAGTPRGCFRCSACMLRPEEKKRAESCPRREKGQRRWPSANARKSRDLRWKNVKRRPKF